MSEGLVVAHYGRHFLVEDPQGQRLICHPRGKKNQAVVGDRVMWQPAQDQGVIERVLPRRNLFYRQDELRSKLFAANLDQLLILIAAEPAYSNHQLSRALIAAEAAGITPLIALNKRDLTDAFAQAWDRLQPYRDMGYSLTGLSLTPPGAELQALREKLQGRATLVLGPSGAGKSTLINALIPGAGAETGALSQALSSGRHTTTRTTWYWLDDTRQGGVIDSPGFQEFGLRHLQPTDLPRFMPDIRVHAGDCRFYNCTHRHEPGCSVRSAVSNTASPSKISPIRYQIYCDLWAELSVSAHG
ncbi:MAG: ribosome small subunit-dependent GTPase A [Rhodoferax sp.]